jgi:hypothetical protein
MARGVSLKTCIIQEKLMVSLHWALHSEIPLRWDTVKTIHYLRLLKMKFIPRSYALHYSVHVFSDIILWY